MARFKHSSLIEIIIKACYKAGGTMMRDLDEVSMLQAAEGDSFVKNTYNRVNKILCYNLQQARPEFHFLTSDEGYIATTPINTVIENGFVFRWVINPVDGLANFVRGRSNFAICVNLEKIAIPQGIDTAEQLRGLMYDSHLQPENIASVIYLPLYREVFWSEKGVGTGFIDSYDRLSSEYIRDKSSLINSIVATNSNLMTQNNELFAKLRNQSLNWRMSGAISIDIAGLLKGRTDLVVFYQEEEIEYYKYAAALALIREAKGKIVDCDLKPLKNVTNAAKGFIVGHTRMIGMLRSLFNKK